MLKKFALTLMLLGVFATPLAFAQDEPDSDDDEMQADDDTGFGDDEVLDEDVVDEDVADEDLVDDDLVDEEFATDDSEDMAESDAEEESVGDVSEEEEEADSDRDDAGDLADESSADSEAFDEDATSEMADSAEQIAPASLPAPVVAAAAPSPPPAASQRDAGATQKSADWPAQQFTFEVDVSGVGTGKFREVSGLESEAQAIEYRHGDSSKYSVQKMPGLNKNGNITLTGATQGSSLSAWRARTTVTIKLLDQAGNSTMVWTLRNAWPTKISGSSIEIAHEGLTVKQ